MRPRYAEKYARKPEILVLAVCFMFEASRPGYYPMSRLIRFMGGSSCGSLKGIRMLCGK